MGSPLVGVRARDHPPARADRGRPRPELILTDEKRERAVAQPHRSVARYSVVGLVGSSHPAASQAPSTRTSGRLWQATARGVRHGVRHICAGADRCAPAAAAATAGDRTAADTGAAPPRKQTIPFDAAVRTGTLPNGLKYLRPQEQPPRQPRAAAPGGEDRIAGRGRRSAGPRARARAHGVQRQRALQAGRAGLVLRVDRRAARAARQRLHRLRRDRLHARPSVRQAGDRREGAHRVRRLRRRADARSRRKSTRNAASSSRNGAAASAPDRGSATSRSRCSSTSRATPSGCRSASPRF